MDLFTGNAAHTMHAQEAQRAEREREYRRIAHERAAALKVETVAKPKLERRSAFAGFFRLRVRSAH
jgi:hypothetical protein